MNQFYRWIPTILLAAIGLFFLSMTYGPLIHAYKNKDKDQYTPSGVPCFGGICLIIAFLISPCKWFAFLGLLDYGLWQVPYMLIENVLIPIFKTK